jgi:hypothetical protein
VWNGTDPILKERLFGLTNGEGNHGEDVKELYFYLDATPSHSWMKCLYKYPQTAYPYGELLSVNGGRSRQEQEFELIDTHALDDDRYFDVVVEYAKASPEDLLGRVTVHNRGPEPATIHVLPTLWFRNTWQHSDDGYRPSLARAATADRSWRRWWRLTKTSGPSRGISTVIRSCCSRRTRRTASGCSAGRTRHRS